MNSKRRGHRALASALRLWLDPIVSPQLATVATMLLVAVLVMANTVSVDGSIRWCLRCRLATG